MRERAVSCESCNLIGSGNGQNFPVSDHGHGNGAKTMNENSNTAKLGKGKTGNGQNFPVSDHGHGNGAKTMNENSNTAKLGKFFVDFWLQNANFSSTHTSHMCCKWKV